MYTKGKWEIENNIVTACNGYLSICEVHDHSATSETHRIEEAEANAHLIAAAPDLLEACKAIQAEMGQLDYPTHTGMALLAMEKVRDAIKKAKSNHDNKD